MAVLGFFEGVVDEAHGGAKDWGGLVCETFDVFDRTADVPVGDLVGLSNVGGEEGLVAEIIHDAWNAARENRGWRAWPIR